MARYDRHYDYGLRGYRETVRREPPVRTRYARDVGGPGGYDQDYGFRSSPYPNRVTARYNVDYVREQHPGEYHFNYTPYGGDRIGRVGDMREYQRPYMTEGGTRTSRGSGIEFRGGYRGGGRGYDFPYRGDYGRWF